MSTDSSTPSSPVRKRQRLSSPTYDDQLGDISQADIEALEQLEAHLSQPIEKNISQLGGHGRDHNMLLSGTSNKNGLILPITEDPENPFAAGFSSAQARYTGFGSAAGIPGFLKASSMHKEEDFNLSQESEGSQSAHELDFDSWFQPASDIPPAAFQTATATLDKPDAPAFVGFAKASNKGVIAPSIDAFAKAQVKMRLWQEEVDDQDTTTTSEKSTTLSIRETDISFFRPASKPSLKLSPKRPALQSVGNSINTLGFASPSTPTPSASSRISTNSNNSAPTNMTPTELFISKNSKPFKSPLLTKRPISNANTPSSPLNPSSRLPRFVTPRLQHPLASIPITATPLNISPPLLSLSTPARHPRLTAPASTLKSRSPAKFVTPFKPGMKPGQPGRLKLEETYRSSQLKQAGIPIERNSDRLTQEGSRNKNSGLTCTGVFDPKLKAMGIADAVELSDMTPTSAQFYSFHTPTGTPLLLSSPSPPIRLGSAQALDTLLDNGCSLATKAWVDNHWNLVLWKLAGMVGLDPQTETIPNQKRWCWGEVMRQLFYR
ncbi:hypothetical protein H0H81_001761 [Sphagnurus paluster]|uniref:Uncharacterized protein n=1 Tax=Sphagnurus paluster TaxID=117069 RepID=A0A9P7GGZ5_9AGAR|nr:hypothetical protein H0H81_001761 [Sphagnurus paluster]